MTLLHGKIPFLANKHFEVEVNRWSWRDGASWFMALFQWTRCRDHAGLELDLELAGLSFRAVIYDCRHWDYDKSTWETHQTCRHWDYDKKAWETHQMSSQAGNETAVPDDD
jgi:hypothetical protein